MQIQNDAKKPGPVIDYIAVIFTITCVIALLIVRGALFYYESGDYLLFLRVWIAEYRSMTFLEGLGTKISMYNPPYMYILNIIARLDFSGLYLIKLVSVFFDILISYFVMKIVALRTNRLNMHILAFLLAFAIPTVILNSSMWGQCDSIYAAFAVGSVYFGLRGKSKTAYAFMAIAVSFKLQAVFLMPMLAVFVFTNRIRLRDCYMFFAVYIATLLPAILTGMSLRDAFFVYFIQANYYSSLNMNIINIWRFIEHVEYNNFRIAGLYMAGVAVLGLLYFTYIHRARLVERADFIRLAYLFAIIIPFLLPKMHDRYYFMADVLSVVVFLYDKRRWYVPVVTILCSYTAYAWFLMSGITIINYRIAALALLCVIIIILKDYVTSLRSGVDPEDTITLQE